MRCCVLVYLLAFGSTAFAQGRSFYIDASGNDASEGSLANPWKTVAPANTFDFEPRDTLFFAGGQSFGQLQLQKNDGGLTLTSYNGTATLGGLYAYNVGGITIDGLNFVGAGTVNKQDGIKFYMDATAGGNLYNLIIKNVSVSNFGGNGILIGAWATSNGYNNVQVLNSSLYGNFVDGFSSYGYYDQYNHTQLYINNVKSYRNYGRTDITSTRTGSGFTVAGFDGALIEHSEAYENGINNRCTGGGPQGFWCYNCKNLTFQYCISHDNRAGRTFDGGGFDIDGGSQACTIQYCYSYNNDGAGLAFFEHGSTNQFTNNTIRYNITENDARRNAHGSVTLWANDTLNRVKNSAIYNNTIYITPSATATAYYPSAVLLKWTNFQNLTFFNNIVYTVDTTKILLGSTTAVTFNNNDYFTLGRTPNFSKGGIIKDPMFTNPGGGKQGYMLRGPSPAVDVGKATSVTVDFIGTPVPSNSGYDMGAYESFLKSPVANAGSDQFLTLPENSATLDGSATTDTDGTITTYSWTQVSGPSTYTINTPAAASTMVTNLVRGTYVFRLTVTDNDSISRFDDVQVLVNPTTGTKLVKVNIFGGTNPFAAADWNNWNVVASRTVTALKYSDGTASTIGAVLSSSSGVYDNGGAYGGVMTAPEVLRYTSYYTSLRTLTLSGLSTTRSYNLELYASRNSNSNSTIFSLGSNTATVVTDNNKSKEANLVNLRPNAAGQLILSIDKKGTYNFLNGFILSENPGTLPAAIAPKSNAGADQTTMLPTATATLLGSGTDTDGTIYSYKWTKYAGPASAIIDAPTSATTTVRNLTEGIYTFRLTVTDNDGLTANDNILVYVNAALPAGTKQIRVNVLSNINSYTNAAWNNWNVSASRTATALNYSDGTTSSVNALLSASSGISDNGATYGGMMAPPEVLRYLSYSSMARTLTLSGLSASAIYNLDLYASRNLAGNSTVFTINGTAITILTGNNKTDVASFTGLSANSSGQIVIGLDKVETYNFLNGFTLTELSQPAPVTRVLLSTEKIKEADAVGLHVYPNPASGSFRLQVARAPVRLTISDALGRRVETRRSVSNTLTFGESYKPGVYFAQVICNNHLTIIKLIKAPH